MRRHYLNTGGRYNPSTDSWTATSTTNAPAARVGHTAVWTGSEMIVWGGYRSASGDLNTGGRYNPSTDSWTATSTTNAPTARSSYIEQLAHCSYWWLSNCPCWDCISRRRSNRPTRILPTPNDHFTTGPHCRVTGSSRGRVVRAGSCPTIRAGIVSPACVKSAERIISYSPPDDHFTASPRRPSVIGPRTRHIDGAGGPPRIISASAGAIRN